MATAQNLNGMERHMAASRPVVGLAVGDLPTRAAYAYALTASGFEVRVIDEPAEQPVRTRPAYLDVLVVDVSADDSDGWALVESLKRDDRTGDVPVIAIVAIADERARAQARRRRCAAVCARTCPPALLSSGIRAVLDATASSLS